MTQCCLPATIAGPHLPPLCRGSARARLRGVQGLHGTPRRRRPLLSRCTRRCLFESTAQHALSTGQHEDLEFRSTCLDGVVEALGTSRCNANGPVQCGCGRAPRLTVAMHGGNKCNLFEPSHGYCVSCGTRDALLLFFARTALTSRSGLPCLCQGFPCPSCPVRVELAFSCSAACVGPCDRPRRAAGRTAAATGRCLDHGC